MSIPMPVLFRLFAGIETPGPLIVNLGLVS